MTFRKPGARRSIFAWCIATFLLTISTILLYASNDTTASTEQTSNWVRNLPASSCPGQPSTTDCHHSSPVLADITGDGKLEIVVVTNNGYVLVYRHDGSLVWKKDTGPAFGMNAGKQRIASSPAVADLDGDGKKEIVVGAGTMRGDVCTQGGVIALDHLGRVKKGWPFMTQDDGVAPSGCRDTVYSTPALGDLDKDGDLEVVFGSFDKRVYAVHHDGRLVSGFTPDSHHYARFGWGVLKGRVADTIWSSPALADIDHDGYLDIVIGTDEGNFESSWAPPVGNWNCPYKEPTTAGYCGGSIYAFDRNGRILEGFPRYKYEIIQSVPAVMDTDGNGQAEIFVGSGSYYNQVSPDKPTFGYRFYGMDSRGNDLPGWEGGKVLGGLVTASPSLGDITGDGKPNIVVAARDKRLYAWHLNGQLVSGFPTSPRTHLNQVLDPYNIGTNFILADYNGNGKMEIFVRHAWEIVVIDGTGQQLTRTYNGEGKPAYVTDGTLWNNPAVGDIDGDGHLELVAFNSKLMVWDLPNSSLRADWPMFKKNAARTSFQQPAVRVVPQEINLVAEKDRADRTSRQLAIYSDLGTSGWQASSTDSARISFPQKSGVVNGEKMVQVQLYVPAGLPLGENHLGDITVKFTQNNKVTVVKTIPVKVNVLRDLNQTFLAVVR